MKPRGERNNLSRREDEVLRLAASGLTDQQIANALGIRVSTVTTYWVRIRGKVGQLNRAELIALCVRQRSQETLNELRAEVARLRTENAELNKELRRQERASSLAISALDKMPCAVLVLRPDGAVSLANRAGEELLGYSREELEQLCIEDILPTVGNRGLLNGQVRIVAVRRRDGARLPARVELRSLEDHHSWAACLISTSVP